MPLSSSGMVPGVALSSMGTIRSVPIYSIVCIFHSISFPRVFYCLDVFHLLVVIFSRFISYNSFFLLNRGEIRFFKVEGGSVTWDEHHQVLILSLYVYVWYTIPKSELTDIWIDRNSISLFVLGLNVSPVAFHETGSSDTRLLPGLDQFKQLCTVSNEDLCKLRTINIYSNSGWELKFNIKSCQFWIEKLIQSCNFVRNVTVTLFRIKYCVCIFFKCSLSIPQAL